MDGQGLQAPLQAWAEREERERHLCCVGRQKGTAAVTPVFGSSQNCVFSSPSKVLAGWASERGFSLESGSSGTAWTPS